MRAIVAVAAVILSTVTALGDCVVPQWQLSTTAALGATSRRTLASADFDKDGRPDVAMISSTGGSMRAVGVLRGLPGGAFAAATAVHSGNDLEELASGDFNGDGNADLLVRQPDEALIFLPGAGDGTFGAAVTTAANGRQLAIGDLTGDGIADAAGVFENTIVIHAGDGAGVFTAAPSVTATNEPWGIAAADLDSDGAFDLVTSSFESATLEVRFGNGDGTFDPPAVITSGLSAGRIRLQDADGDGDLDIIAPNWEDNDVAVHRNAGSRVFDPVVRYDVTSPHWDETNPIDAAIGDVTGDGVADLLVSNVNSGELVTLRGNGNGTFGVPSFAGFPAGSPFGNAIGGPLLPPIDLDGDGRADVIAISLVNDGIIVFRNRCGDATLTVTPEPAAVTIGQTALLRVTASPVDDYFRRVPAATGNVSILQGDTVLATGTMSGGSVVISVPGLALGEHTLLARYAGDDQYEPAESGSATVRVTNDSTTTTVTVEPAETVYGEPFELTAHVTASDETTPGGAIELGVDLAFPQLLSAPHAVVSNLRVRVGTHTVYARYRGDDTHPRSEASPATLIVRKATPELSFSRVIGTNATGSAVSIELSVGPLDPTGSVDLFDGKTFVATRTIETPSHIHFELTGLTPGQHHFQARYAGDANFHAGQSPVATHQVFAAGSLALDIRGSNAGIVAAFSKPPDATLFLARSEAPNQNFQSGFHVQHSPELDDSAATDVVYLYRLESRDPETNALLAASPVDLGVRMSFSDEPLLPSMRIRASHLAEIVAATNFLRGKAGQSLVNFTDLAAGQPIRASHITTLRTKINEARIALGAAAYSFTNAVAAGTSIRALDVQELREAVH